MSAKNVDNAFPYYASCQAVANLAQPTRWKCFLQMYGKEDQGAVAELDIQDSNPLRCDERCRSTVELYKQFWFQTVLPRQFEALSQRIQTKTS